MGRKQSGSITVLGLDHKEDEAVMKRQVGYVSPDLNFLAWGRVGKAIQFIRGFYDTWDDSYCQRLLQEFRLGWDEKIATLSFGAKIKFNLLLSWQSAVYSALFLGLVATFHFSFKSGTTLPGFDNSYGTWKNHLFMCNIFAVSLCLLFSLHWVQSLRAWRTLPVTTCQLSLNLFLLPLCPGVVFWMVVATAGLVLGSSEAIYEWSKILFLLLGGISLIVPLGLRTGLNLLLLLIVLGLAGIAPMIMEVTEVFQVTLATSLIIGSTLLLCGYLYCHWIIDRRSEGYRPLKLSWIQPQ